jgi:hypothetical protein
LGVYDWDMLLRDKKLSGVFVRFRAPLQRSIGNVTKQIAWSFALYLDHLLT